MLETYRVICTKYLAFFFCLPRSSFWDFHVDGQIFCFLRVDEFAIGLWALGLQRVGVCLGGVSGCITDTCVV